MPSTAEQAISRPLLSRSLASRAKIQTKDKPLKAQEIPLSMGIDLAELEKPMLEAALGERGQESFRARQLFAWIYRRGITDIAAMTDLPRELRATLATDFRLTTPEVVSREQSS